MNFMWTINKTAYKVIHSDFILKFKMLILLTHSTIVYLQNEGNRLPMAYSGYEGFCHTEHTLLH